MYLYKHPSRTVRISHRFSRYLSIDKNLLLPFQPTLQPALALSGHYVQKQICLQSQENPAVYSKKWPISMEAEPKKKRVNRLSPTKFRNRKIKRSFKKHWILKSQNNKNLNNSELSKKPCELLRWNIQIESIYKNV